MLCCLTAPTNMRRISASVGTVIRWPACSHNAGLEVHLSSGYRNSAIRSLRAGRSRRSARAASLVVQMFLGFPLPAAVVLHAAASGILPAVGLPASEGTGQIAPMRVTGMGQKENPAMPATAHIPPQAGFLSQQGAQDNVVLPHQFPDGRTATIPVRTELELLLDFNYQKPRDWLTMETLQYTPFVLPSGSPR